MTLVDLLHECRLPVTAPADHWGISLHTMINMLSSLEVSVDVATLYFRGSPRPDDIRAARRQCARLPSCVSILRIDLHGVRSMSSDSHDELVTLVREWRRCRDAHVIVAAGMSEFALFVNPMRSADRADAAVTSGVLRGWSPDSDAHGSADAALMGVFL